MLLNFRFFQILANDNQNLLSFCDFLQTEILSACIQLQIACIGKREKALYTNNISTGAIRKDGFCGFFYVIENCVSYYIKILRQDAYSLKK